MAFLFSVCRLDSIGARGGGPLGLAIAVMAVHFIRGLSKDEATAITKTLRERELISLSPTGTRYRITTRGLGRLPSYRTEAGLQAFKG